MQNGRLGAGMTMSQAAPSRAGRRPETRQRLLDGLLAAICEKGYQSTTVADIVRHARTSRRTFYQWFDTREDCYVALMDRSDLELRDQVAASVDTGAVWTEQIRQAVLAYVDHVMANSAIILSSIRDLPSLGTPALAQKRRTFDSLAHLLIQMVDGERFREAGVEPPSRATAHLLLGGVQELTAMLVEDGDDPRDMTETVVTAVVAVLAARA